uniref:Uncharacterized protein n=1 Tax=Ciona savignyi TaxID=51511 RepID=H2ZE91_CIOSA
KLSRKGRDSSESAIESQVEGIGLKTTISEINSSNQQIPTNNSDLPAVESWTSPIKTPPLH